MKAKAKKRINMHGNAVQSKTVTVHVTKDDIQNAECGNPNGCMIKVALKRALNLAHGYIHVDASGISISRNGMYREKAFMPRSAQVRMLAFDRKDDVKPFRFKATFFKTTKVADAARRVITTKAMKKFRAKKSYVEKKYDMRSRVIGIAVGAGTYDRATA